MLRRKASTPAPIGPHSWRLLAVSLLLALLFGAVSFGEPLEDALRVVRNNIAPVSASGEIVVVKIDEKSMREVGRWPWSRDIDAKLIDRLSDAGARKILLDITFQFSDGSNASNVLEDSIERSGRVVLPVHLKGGERGGQAHSKLPLERFATHAQLGLISANYNYANSVWRVLYAWRDDGGTYPSFASIMGNVAGSPGVSFPVNYRIDPDTLPQLSAADVLAGRFDPRTLRGRTILVGTASEDIGDQFQVPGRGRIGGMFIQALGAETLMRGRPVSLGWIPALLLVLPIAWFAIGRRRPRDQGGVMVAGATAILALPQLTETYQWFMDVTPALFLLVCVGSALAWRRHKLRGTVNLASGLPNLNALRACHDQRDRALIVARILNYPRLAAAVATSSERALVEQVVQRLTVGSHDYVIYQGDEGIFAWLTDPGIAIGHHVEALHSLFRSPARIDGAVYDLGVTFGVEIGSGRTVTQRLNSALVAADEAASEGLKWKYHDPERMKDDSWRLSLLSQLDQAIESGEVWVAFQPQLDLATGRIRGAEALARWTHPEKGPISPQEFVSAAEQGGRIEKLTLFVLDRAVATAAKINREGSPFDMAVNLSAKMLGMKSLPVEVRAILARHGLPAERLTLELTETAALAGDGSDLAPLFKLRDLGVRLSIDDYGTGLSTLDYLKKVPANEIKIDQSFIKAMRDSRSDLVMVQSTIALAHSLRRVVVAEGVEEEAVLDLLRSLKCDVAQGFLISRPTSHQGLVRRLQDERRRHAA